MMVTRFETIRQRAVAQGMIIDDGPADEGQVADECAFIGITVDDLCEELEGFLDSDLEVQGT